MDGSPLTLRQGELLDHAVVLVREVGLAGLTVRRLAESVGFSEAALYRHFPNKQALLLAMIERLSEERLLVPLRALAAAPDRPPRERLAAILEHHVRTVLAVDGLPVLVLAEAAAAGDEPLLARFRAIVGEMLGLIEDLLVVAAADGTSRTAPGGASAGGSSAPPGIGGGAAGATTPSPRALALALFGVAAAAALHHRLFADPDLERELGAVVPRFLVRCVLGEGEP